MSRRLTLFLLALLVLPVQADDTIPVKIGDVEIQLSRPAGMVDIPKDSVDAKAVADLTPPDCILLRTCISSDALDNTKAPDPSADIMTSRVFVIKEVQMNIDSGSFIDFVQQQAFQVSHGILISQDSCFDFVETQKRLDDFQKDTGVKMEDTGDIYSLGVVSRSYACIAFMTANYMNSTENGKTQRLKCISVYSYVRLKEKVVVILTSLIKPLILHEDIRTLKHAAEKYQLDLQFLNNS